LSAAGIRDRPGRLVVRLAGGRPSHVASGQFGLGLGAVLVLTCFAMLFSIGLAGLGYFKGDPFVAASVVAVTTLVAVFTFFPVVRILISALQDAGGAFSLTAIPERLFAEKIWGLGCIAGSTRCGVAWNTLVLAFLCAAGCTGLGLAFALIATRTGFKYKGALRVLTILPIITPPFVIGLGLILIFGRSGLVNQMLEAVFGWQLGRWIYGLQGVLVAQVFAFTPIAFLVLIGVVEGVSPSMEEAAQTLRADKWRVFADISLPLMRPGLANAFLISFIESIADFGNPILLGGNFGVLSTEIFFSVVGAQLDQGRAATLGVLLLAIAFGAFFLQRAVLGRKVYTSLAGKGDSGLPTPLPDRCAPSLLRRRGAVGAADVRHLRDGARRRLRRDLGPRLHAHASPLREGLRRRMVEPWPLWTGAAWSSFWTTVKLSAIAAPATAALGILTAYLLTRHRFAASRPSSSARCCRSRFPER
jgi:iron(III) transport system permease protein